MIAEFAYHVRAFFLWNIKLKVVPLAHYPKEKKVREVIYRSFVTFVTVYSFMYALIFFRYRCKLGFHRLVTKNNFETENVILALLELFAPHYIQCEPQDAGMDCYELIWLPRFYCFLVISQFQVVLLHTEPVDKTK